MIHLFLSNWSDKNLNTYDIHCWRGMGKSTLQWTVGKATANTATWGPLWQYLLHTKCVIPFDLAIITQEYVHVLKSHG